MLKTRVIQAIAFGILFGLGAAQGPANAQVNPPQITIPTSGVAYGDSVTVSGRNFSPGSLVFLRLTGPLADSWTKSVNVGSDGSISYPIRFNEEGVYLLEVVARDGLPLALLKLSSARRQ
jgi:hypothetical protein